MHTRQQERGWYIVKQNHMTSHNDDGYQSYYYYCGDVTRFLNTTWIPVLAWLTLNIIPILFLVILSNVTHLNIFLKLPDIIPIALLSHFIIWTVEENQDAPNSQTAQRLRKYGVSKLLSALSILISGVSTFVTLYLCFGPRFGPGDGAFLRFLNMIYFAILTLFTGGLYHYLSWCPQDWPPLSSASWSYVFLSKVYKLFKCLIEQ